MATILDSLVGSCAKKLQDIITEEVILILGVKEDLKQLQRAVNQIHCFLDAEQRSTEESAVSSWLSELKDAMYEADDIFDLARLEGNKLLMDYASSSRTSAACTRFLLCSCLPNIQRCHEIATRIRKFNTELEKILRLGERFLRLQNMLPKVEVSAVRRKKTCELLEPNLVGKEASLSCTRLLELILSQKENKEYKVGIVGTGGVGKTTLAQKIYNDHKIKGNFSKRAWVCVSQVYNEVAILKEVLRNIEISRALEDKIFFLVLDDVWQYEVWTDVLRTPLNTAAIGIVLVTTRNDTVARAIGVDKMHRVELMSVDVGWELLWKSMNISKESDVQNLRGIGMQIVHLCGGLPLAIKVTASVLATKEKSENEWRKVLNRSAWGALYLSYDELPRCLKQCFLYCALYPEDFIMHRDDLIRYWVTEGFVQEQEEQLVEDTVRNIFDYARCKMHDLLRQLAQHLSQDESFCGEPWSLEAKSLARPWRVSIVTDKDVLMPPKMDKATGIPYLPESVGSLINLQVLSLQGCHALHSLPTTVTRLCNLRRLGIFGTPINRVPKGIGGLKFLNDLEGFIVGDGSDNSSRMQDGWNLEELGPLLQLRQLEVNKLERAVPCTAGPFLIDKKYLKVLELSCTQCIDKPYAERDINNIEKMFEWLIPPHVLEDLVIERFFGWRYPTWLSTTHLSSLKYLNLIHCKSWVHLPPVGKLPHLKYLRIVGATTVNKIGPEFVGCSIGSPGSADAVAFPNLEHLIIDDMPNLEEWSIVEEDAASWQNGKALVPMLQLLPQLQKLDILAYATSLKSLQLRKAACLKEVENLPFLSDLLLITGCGRLERVFNIPQMQQQQQQQQQQEMTEQSSRCWQQQEMQVPSYLSRCSQDVLETHVHSLQKYLAATGTTK
uniref:AAA+ ATPase domain-containing protein n=1 Tax=Setaria italica TaxID=4555 RepID=K3ZLJ5_SETIT